MNTSKYRQILIDIDCNNEEIKTFIECENNSFKLIKFLENKRRELLVDYHCAARKIDCLDYLTSEISKECK